MHLVGREDAQRVALDAAATTPAAAAASPPVVVVVSPDRAEQQRVLEALPPDAVVVLAATVEQAELVLRRESGPPARLTDPPSAYLMEADTRLVRVGERTVRLTPLEFSMLRVLSSEPGRIWSFAELAQHVWATGHVGDGAQVRSVVKRLRRKLAEADAPVYVEAVRSAGLRLRRRTATELPE